MRISEIILQIVLVFSMRFASSDEGLESFPLRYSSMIKPAIGAATSAPKPPCSMYTAMAIFGLSIGAKPMMPNDPCPDSLPYPSFHTPDNQDYLRQ